MPIVSNSPLVPLSLNWTHRQLVSEAMLLTNTVDHDVVHTDHVRSHLNVAISHIADLLNSSNHPWYGMALLAFFENSLHPQGLLEYVNLATAPIGIHKILRIDFQAQNPYGFTPILWTGNCPEKDLTFINQLNTYHNNGYRHTILWAHHGSQILFFVGANISTVNRAALRASIMSANPGYINDDFKIDTEASNLCIWINRQPLLDNMQPMTMPNSGWLQNVDLPDRYIKLALQMTQKMILEQLNQQAPAQLEANIVQAVQQITGQLNNDLAFEKQTRERTRYGSPQPIQGVPANG